MQVLLTEQSGFLPSILHECVGTVLGGTALQEMVAFFADETRFIGINPLSAKGVKLSVLVKFQERKRSSASIDTHCSLRQESISNIIFLPQVLLVAGKDHPRTSCRD